MKTGCMVGLGETEAEIDALLEEVGGAGVDMVTIGQYLRPSKLHLPVVEYVAPAVFERYRERGEALGLQVHAAPFVRSSFPGRRELRPGLGACEAWELRRREVIIGNAGSGSLVGFHTRGRSGPIPVFCARSRATKARTYGGING